MWYPPIIPPDLREKPRKPVNLDVRPHMLAHSKIPVTIGLALTLLSACEAKYHDVSTEPPYAKYANQTCAITQELQAQGIAVNYERARGTDYIVVQQPLAVRSYTTFVNAIHPGAKFKVLSVRKCTNCPFDDRVEFRVAFDSEPEKFGGKPVYLVPSDALDGVANCG